MAAILNFSSIFKNQLHILMLLGIKKKWPDYFFEFGAHEKNEVWP